MRCALKTLNRSLLLLLSCTKLAKIFTLQFWIILVLRAMTFWTFWMLLRLEHWIALWIKIGPADSYTFHPHFFLFHYDQRDCNRGPSRCSNGAEMLQVLDTLAADVAGFDYIESPMIAQVLGIPTLEAVEFWCYTRGVQFPSFFLWRNATFCCSQSCHSRC